MWSIPVVFHLINKIYLNLYSNKTLFINLFRNILVLTSSQRISPREQQSTVSGLIKSLLAFSLNISQDRDLYFIQNFIPLCIFAFNIENIREFVRVNSCLDKVMQLYFQAIHKRKVSDTVWLWWELMFALLCNMASNSVWWQRHYLMICL
jgi:hypothetical protein